MLLLQKNEPDLHLIALFGVGLVGSAVAAALNKLSDIQTSSLEWHWGSDRKENGSNLRQYINKHFGNKNIHQISAVWCAGKAGFSTNDITSERDDFKVVLDWFEHTIREFPGTTFSFHLTSSAGGLFENQQSINTTSTPHPLRPYGHLKQQQEDLLLRADTTINKHIYRPTSIYGFPVPGQRMGLIPTLISNGIRNRVSRISGHQDTLRDYVLADDIGHYIASRIITFPEPDDKPRYYLLGSGRPASIFEIRHLVEARIQRKVFLQLRPDKTGNTGNIALNPRAMPPGWQACDLKSGIQSVYLQLLNPDMMKQVLV